MELLKQPQLFQQLQVIGCGLRSSEVFTEAAVNSNKKRKSEVKKEERGARPSWRSESLKICDVLMSSNESLQPAMPTCSE